MKHAFTLLLLAGTCSASGQWLTDSLIAQFPMDGSPNDVVGGLAPIATIGAPIFCTSRTGGLDSAACFDGDDFWRYGNVLNMDTSMFSISFWCRIDGITTNSTAHDYPLSKGTTLFGTPTLSGYSFGFRDELPDTLSAACLWGQGGQPLIIQDQATTFGSWNHYTMSRCPDDVVQMRVNGSLVAQDTLDIDASLSTNIYFSIGAGDREPATGPVGYFQGAVDDVRIYKGRCLSQAEINVLADLTVGVEQPHVAGLELQMSPNPATNSLRIMLPPRRDVSGPVQVYDATGRRMPVRADELTLDNASVRSIQLNVAHLPQGAYFVVVPTDNVRMHGRFIKE